MKLSLIILLREEAPEAQKGRHMTEVTWQREQGSWDLNPQLTDTTLPLVPNAINPRATREKGSLHVAPKPCKNSHSGRAALARH